MSSRQQEKSDMTKRELTDAMVTLCLRNGYESTSIKDITDAAGYSVGSFYRHWKGKQQAFLEYCDEYVSEFIRQSVESAPLTRDVGVMLDFLIARSEAFARSDKTVKLYAASRVMSGESESDNLALWAGRYTGMLCDFLRLSTRCRNDQRLVTAANILHAVLDAHAMQSTQSALPHFEIDSANMRACLMAIIDSLND